MKIIDSFIFYNELDLLYYRLSILDKYVDYFILVEATHTHSGHPKKLFYNENKDRLTKFNDKIIHIIVDDFPHKVPNVNYKRNHSWNNENFHRNCISRGINCIKNKLNHIDVILTSDLDEIPNPDILHKLKNNTLNYDKNRLNKLSCDMYYYNLNTRVGDGQNWHGIKLLTCFTYNNIKLTFQEMRVWEHNHHVNAIPYGGWHLSYFGNSDFIINKITFFAHQELNNDNILNKEKIDIMMENDINNEYIQKGISFHGDVKLQYIKTKDNVNLPPEYEIYLKNYYIE